MSALLAVTVSPSFPGPFASRRVGLSRLSYGNSYGGFLLTVLESFDGNVLCDRELIGSLNARRDRANVLAEQFPAPICAKSLIGCRRRASPFAS